MQILVFTLPFANLRHERVRIDTRPSPHSKQQSWWVPRNKAISSHSTFRRSRSCHDYNKQVIVPLQILSFISWNDLEWASLLLWKVFQRKPLLRQWLLDVGGTLKIISLLLLLVFQIKCKVPFGAGEVRPRTGRWQEGCCRGSATGLVKSSYGYERTLDVYIYVTFGVLDTLSQHTCTHTHTRTHTPTHTHHTHHTHTHTHTRLTY